MLAVGMSGSDVAQSFVALPCPASAGHDGIDGRDSVSDNSHD
jgi:hypothetical protein